MSLSAVIVDDEQLARDELAFLLKDVGDVDVVAQGKNGLEGVNLIREHNPDLVFLDVQMPGLDGFGVIKKLLDKKVHLPKIVFATAFDQYAVKAFEVNAVDYLLKPFDKKRVAQSVQKGRAKLESGSRNHEIFACACRATLVKVSWRMRKSAVATSRSVTTSFGGKSNRHLVPVRIWNSFAAHSTAGTRPRSSRIPGLRSFDILRTDRIVSSINLNRDADCS